MAHREVALPATVLRGLLVLALALGMLPAGPLTQASAQTAAGAYAAEVVSVTGIEGPVPTGGERTITVAYRNTGTEAWRPGVVYLATAIPRDRISFFHHSSWPWSNRPATLTSEVAPGAVGIFTFPMHAGVRRGRYVESFQLVAEGITWFPEGTLVTLGVSVEGDQPVLTPGDEAQTKTGKLTLGALDVVGSAQLQGGAVVSGTLSVGTLRVSSGELVPNLYAARAAVADSCTGCVVSGGVAGVSQLRAGAQPWLTGAVSLNAGSNITLTQTGNDITIAASGSGSGGYATLANAGTAVTQRGTINIPASAGLIAADDAGGSRTNLSVDTSVVTTLSGSQTLTNKTLTSPVINTPTGNIVTAVSKSGSSALTGAVTLSQGANIALTQSGNDIAVAVTGLPTTAYQTVQNGGAGLTQRATLNAGSGLVAADNGGSSRTDLSVDSSVVALLSGTQTLDAKTLTNAGAITQTGVVGITSGTGTSTFNGTVALTGYADVSAIAAPGNPAASTGRFFFDTADSKLKIKKSDGTVVDLEAAGLTQAYQTVQQGGTGVTQRSVINFGSGLTAVDNGASTRTDIGLDSSVVALLSGVQTLDQKTLTNAGAITQTGAVGLTSGSGTSTFNGAVVISGSNTLSIGTNPAGAGAIRLPNAQYLTARNSANNADVQLIGLNASDQPVLQNNTVGTDGAGFRELPNLVGNSDFWRRTKWMTFMPEVFDDTSGWTLIDGGLGSTASNLWTPVPAAGNFEARAGLPWRDARISGLFQAQGNAVNDTVVVGFYVDANNWLRAQLDLNLGRLYITERVGGVTANLTNTSDAGAVTVGNYYWVELDRRGTELTARWYTAGGSASAKAGAALQASAVATTTLPTTSAGYAYVRTYQAGTTHNVGGLASGDGGVYVEGWGPESWITSFFGTKGAQAIGFEEAADSGPLGKQWALAMHIPQASRAIDIRYRAKISPSTTYTLSVYQKVANLGGSGPLLSLAAAAFNSSGVSGTAPTNVAVDSGETTWTPKSGAWTSSATGVEASFYISANYDRNAFAVRSATGTAYVMLAQLEQGSVATPWRRAPADTAAVPFARGARVYSSSNINVPNSGSYGSAIVFNRVRWDTDGFYSTSTGRITIPTGMDGLYFIAFQAHWNENGAGGHAQRIYKNSQTGAPVTIAAVGQDSSVNSDNQVVSTVEWLRAGDTVEVNVFQNSGAAKDILVTSEDSPYFMIAYLGPVPAKVP